MDWLEGIKDGFSGFIDAIIDVLPQSPISYLIRTPEANKIMGYVNFFIPIYTFIGLAEMWLTAIAVYYLLQVILRWLKVIE